MIPAQFNTVAPKVTTCPHCGGLCEFLDWAIDIRFAQQCANYLCRSCDTGSQLIFNNEELGIVVDPDVIARWIDNA